MLSDSFVPFEICAGCFSKQEEIEKLKAALAVATRIWHYSACGTRVMKSGCSCPVCVNSRKALSGMEVDE